MTESDKEHGATDTGVKVVGASSSTPGALSPADDVAPPRAAGRLPRQPSRPRRVTLLSVVAAAGLTGTLVFGLLWGFSGGSDSQDPAVLSSARVFLNDLTNFNAKSVDANFGAITAMATGSFSGQATKFFNSAIREDLEKALAESRGQIRKIYVQDDNGSAASVYAVVDQVYANDKISTAQSDVLRVVVNLALVGSKWKISDVTVLEGATAASAGSASGSAGSAVPGQ